ncbi:hypothetical protein HUJ04_010577 [Dendroctonus ponderosae]|uniref:TLC domain-containing protein n=2 Tax=Dendroctonus ponderosae TaxID=77166 RepID=A0AAR5PMS3_DENPD|nr:hypothetical protein HUJ04_010577 [Dendroctonus ponderosae]
MEGDGSTAPISPPINYNVYFPNGYINYESPICMVISAVLWRSFYILIRFFFPHVAPEFSSRILSATHGLLSAFLGINQCFLFDWPFDHPEWKTSYIQSFVMTMSFGYFVHDGLWMLKYDRKDKTMICHHLLCILGLTKIIFKGYSGGQATCALGSMEITNPFLQGRWFLRTAGMQNTPVYKSTELTFFLVFIVVRIVIGSYFLNIILRQPKNDWDFIIMSLGIYILSWLFAWGMLKYVWKHYVQSRPDEKT